VSVFGWSPMRGILTAGIRWDRLRQAVLGAEEDPVLPGSRGRASCLGAAFVLALSLRSSAQEPPRAFIDGTGPGWRTLGESDFAGVNGNPDTWTWKDGRLLCSGRPIGVLRTRQKFTNVEMVVQWRHLRSAGNSGVFVWVPDEALEQLKPDKLPEYGIEVQMLDHGFREQYEKQSGKKGDWFTTHGDIFAVGKSKLTPFPPLSPDGSRSFPRKDLSRGVGEWNHYYVRAINGELRLWVNGEEVSGGRGAEPRTGYLCMESEGSPIEFKDIRVRELP
jgi:3-keto-disaccharide hydrolase